MFSASDFTYDGVRSGKYGLVIADFNAESVAETAAFSSVLRTTKPATLNKFIHSGIQYDTAPQFQFSVISETEIPDIVRREILSWLVGRNEFKRLEIHQPDLGKYYYKCVFTEASIIFVHGRCHGFRVTAVFDSPYAYGNPTVISVPSAGEYTITIKNTSDLRDTYVYPKVTFTGSGITIINNTDDPKRNFVFTDLDDDEQIVVDNEIKYISSSKKLTRLDKFNKQWLRLRKGDNSLTIISDGPVTIECPCYVMIGF